MNALWLAALLSSAVVGSEEEPALFALVVGNNAPLPDSGYPHLRYADDDAIRFARAMRAIGAHVELLTAVDQESSQRFGEISAVPPKKKQLLQALDRLKRRLEAAEGRRREVFFYFSGHGSVSSSNSYLHLLDAPFYRTDLYEQVLERLPREQMHLIIDSCHAYFLVNARGRVLAEEDPALSQYPDVGLLLSTDNSKEVHEWSGFQAGVFSYQVLGALLGAADSDENDEISYLEAHAYILAANDGVRDQRARIQPFIKAPAGRSTLVRLKPNRVLVPPRIEGHLQIRDDRGYPLLDAHKPAGVPLRISALTPSPLLMEVEGRSYRVEETQDGLRFRDQPSALVPAGTRGRIEDEFRMNLFKRPFTPDLVQGMELAMQARLPASVVRVERSSYSRPFVWSLVGVGLGGLALGAGFTPLFLKEKAKVNASSPIDDYDRVRARSENFRAVMVGGFVSGGVLLLSAALYAWLSEG